MSLLEYMEQHEEVAFVAKALVMAVLIIIFKNLLSSLMGFLAVAFPIGYLISLRMHAATSGVSEWELLKEHITFFPLMRSVEERRQESIPWVTYGLILVNAVIFYGIELNISSGFIRDYLVFLPGRPDRFNVFLSAFTSLFLHSSSAHLWGNMTFLWVVGTAVERRVGRMNFFRLYLLTGLLGGLVYLGTERIFHHQVGHILGASGAIAGIMGIFAVRCYFKTMIFPVPILGVFSLFFPISLKIRLNSLMVMALFFLSDLSGGIGQLSGADNSMVGHWAHLGGMISGMMIAGYLKLGGEAVQERHLEIGIQASERSIGYQEGERSLQIVLDQTPDKVEALLGLARIKTKYGKDPAGVELFEKAMGQLITQSPIEAVEVFREYWNKFRELPADAQLVLRLVQQLRLTGEHELCINCLEGLVEILEPADPERERALFQLATLLEFTRRFEASRDCFARFVREYPASVLAEKARTKTGGAPETGAPQQAQEKPCPGCGTPMTVRTVQAGPRRGERFWVCGRYPGCRSMMPVIEIAEAFEHNLVALQLQPETYRLVFEGQLPKDCDAEEVKGNLSRLLRCGRDRIDALCGGSRTVLKRGLEHQTAVQMKEAFDRSGALCSIEREGAPPLPAVFEPQAAPLHPPPPAITCPKCGQPQERGACCIKCGVYFAKLVMQAERDLLPLTARNVGR